MRAANQRAPAAPAATRRAASARRAGAPEPVSAQSPSRWRPLFLMLTRRPMAASTGAGRTAGPAAVGPGGTGVTGPIRGGPGGRPAQFRLAPGEQPTACALRRSLGGGLAPLTVRATGCQ